MTKILESFQVTIPRNGTPRVTNAETGEEVELEKKEDEFYFRFLGKDIAVSMWMYYKMYNFDSKYRILVQFGERYNYTTISYVKLSEPKYTPFFLKGNFYEMYNVKTGEMTKLDKITDVCLVLGKRKVELYENLFDGKMHGDLKITKLVGAGVSNSLYEGGYLSDDSIDQELIAKDSDGGEDLVDLNVY